MPVCTTSREDQADFVSVPRPDPGARPFEEATPRGTVAYGRLPGTRTRGSTGRIDEDHRSVRRENLQARKQVETRLDRVHRHVNPVQDLPLHRRAIGPDDKPEMHAWRMS
jgi:hypothetical protein